ncbi:MAG: glycoside hydrolase family 78 protein [Lachnospiraceae bacterium]|nr:glycoside hydrolase family 78 protein [Lachnospiraceae bacterium]
MNIIDLKCNYQTDPVGIFLEKTVFTWKCVETRGKKTQNVNFVIAGDCNFKNIFFNEDKDVSSPYSPDVRFENGKTYYWKVTVTDDSGDTCESKVSSFEGGHPEDGFSGKWISPRFTHDIHPVMRKTFMLTGEDLERIRTGRLYICGLGLYEAYLNGKKIGDDYLTPYFTDYRYWIEYQTYAIEGYLKEGKNTLDVYLGNGWYKGKFGYLAQGQMCEYYGDSFKMIADMFLYGENYKKCINSDESWVCLKSPVASSGIYDGEVWDFRKQETMDEPDVREISGAVSADPPEGKLMPMVGLPVRAHERLKPVELINTPAGELVLDFGQEITGWAEFTNETQADNRVVLEYGEVLQKGNFYRDNLRTAEAKYTYISSGNKDRARAHFTFFGFRYVKVTGMTKEEIQKADFEAVAIYSDLDETGYIETSNEKLNRLIANTKWSQKDNFLDIPTDCPQRDERCGWTGDAQIFSGAASYHMETPAFFRKYMIDMLYEQREKGGAVPYVVPDVLTIGREKMAEPEFDMSREGWGEAGASVWGDAAVIIPWNMYLHFGNESWLSEQYANMKEWSDFMIHMEEDHCGGRRLWDCGFHFGDWLSLDVEGDITGMDNREGGTDKYYVASLYYMTSLEITSKVAVILGKNEDAQKYHKRSLEVREAMRRKYRTGKGTLNINTQTAYAIAIWFDLFDEDEMKEAGDNLLSVLKAWNYHLATGFVGTTFLCSALTKAGHSEEAYTLLLNEDYPSWLYEVNQGATTIWERWNSILPDGSISGTGMNSLNHYAYGAIVEWIYTFVCGISVDEEHIAGRRMRITPHTDKRLKWARASVDMSVGKYESGWELNKDTVSFSFRVPFDSEAVFVPDRELKEITLNGEKISQEDLVNRSFCMGDYNIRATYVN